MVASRTRTSRRDFIRITALGLGSLAFRPMERWFAQTDFPQAERLGRVCVGKVDLKVRPDPDSGTAGVLYEDAVLPWLREISGRQPYYVFSNQRWVETPQGYIYGPYFQPVEYRPNEPIAELPASSRGAGMWVEITVPYADIQLERDPSSNSWVKNKLDEGMPLRVYYSQCFWVDQVKPSRFGGMLYRINPNYYGGVDMLWAPASACRPIDRAEMTPIHPEGIDKRIEIDVTHQTLTCYEGKAEVYFCRISSGAKFDMYGNVVDAWATPVGTHRVTRKFVSLQMAGGTTGAGYDLPGIAWTSIFATGGVAIHSTFWHNNYGDPVSHGCVNCSPEDAKWIWRWSMPGVEYDPGMVDVTVTGEASTRVDVVEG